jgi:para-nitrobenzyl esterase
MGNATPGLAGGVVKGDASKPVPKTPPPVGASHASEIEYAMGNLTGNKTYAWTPEDFKVSETMENYFANFIKNANPNGKGLPKWSAITDNNKVKFMNIDVKSQEQVETDRARYLFLDKDYMK